MGRRADEPERAGHRGSEHDDVLAGDRVAVQDRRPGWAEAGAASQASRPPAITGEHLAVEHRRSEDHTRRVVRVAGAQVGLEPLVHGVTKARRHVRAR